MANGDGFVAAVDNFINKLIIEPAGRALKGGLSALGGAFSGFGEAGESQGGGFLSGLKESLFGNHTHSSPSISAPVQEPSLAINTPSPSLGRHEVDMAEIGQFSAPQFSVAARNTGIGMGSFS